MGGGARSRSRSRDRGRDRGWRSRSRSRERARDGGHHHRRRGHSRSRSRSRSRDKRERERAPASQPEAPKADAGAAAAEAEAKRLRRLEAARLLAQRTGAPTSGGATAPPANAAPAPAVVGVAPQVPSAAAQREPSPPPAIGQRTSYVPSWIPGREKDEEGAVEDVSCHDEDGNGGEANGDEVDPLDAFMADQIMPEVAQRAAAEAAAKAEARLKRAAELAEAARLGVAPPPLADPALAELLADDDGEEEKPTEVIVVPTNKVKLIVGAGGENIKLIQRKSKARLQVLKKEEALGRAFGTDAEWRAKEVAEKAAKAMAIAQVQAKKRAEKQAAAALLLENGGGAGGGRGGKPALLMDSAAAAELAAGLSAMEEQQQLEDDKIVAAPPPAPPPPQHASTGGGVLTTAEKPGAMSAKGQQPQRTAATTFAAAAAVADDTTQIALYGTIEACAIAKRMIDELFAEAAEARRDAHASQRDKEKEKKAANRRLYLLRHAPDYHMLGVPPGTSKDDLRKAFRKLAIIWHPDKHPEGPEREAAAKKFMEIQKAFDTLMSTDEEATIEALAY